MEMTIKQLANQLGVSKTTISKAISALGLQGELKRFGNKYLLSEVQIESVKTQIEKPKTQTTNHKMQTNSENVGIEVPKMQTESEKTQTENQKALIEVLQKQLALLNEQLSIKDGQIKAYQEQIRILTDSLHDATVALTAEQALHAGTIQRQLTEQINSKEEAALDHQEQPNHKQSIFSKLFGRKNGM